jgi:signal-transduction protein with cAMP-binding, CBS, and nucleotidyltransferase domain
MKKLSLNDLNILKASFEPLIFKNAFDLVYEKQIPNTGVVFLGGALELLRNKQVVDQIQPGCILGIHHLVHNEPVKLGWKVKENSVLIMLQKSDIFEALKNHSSDLHRIFSDGMTNDN